MSSDAVSSTLVVRAGSDVAGPDKSARASLISQALKEAAQRAQQTLDTWAPEIAREEAPVKRRSLLPAIIIAFAIVVALPSIVWGIYLGFFASDQYASEFRFAVRGGESSVLESVGSNLTVATALQRLQDSVVVSEYVQGRDLVEELDRSIGLRKLFSRPTIDYLWRFNPKGTIEDLKRYWGHRVDVSIDPLSGIITVIVCAFSPQDSLVIAKAIIKNSENLVNQMSERSRRDALRQAQNELKRTETVLQQKTAAFQQVRNTGRVIDLTKAADSLTLLISQLRLQLLGYENSYGVQRKTISASAPQLQILEKQIKSTKDQIHRLEEQMTSTSGESGSSTPTLSASMSRFEQAQLEWTLASQQYAFAASAFERARVDLESQLVYLSTFTQPVLAQDALYPRRGLLWSMVFFAGLLLWGAGTGMAILIRNHMGF
jgi:capsular polysaccharide transport system permease protein